MYKFRSHSSRGKDVAAVAEVSAASSIVDKIKRDESSCSDEGEHDSLLFRASESSVGNAREISALNADDEEDTDSEYNFERERPATIVLEAAAHEAQAHETTHAAHDAPSRFSTRWKSLGISSRIRSTTHSQSSTAPTNHNLTPIAESSSKASAPQQQEAAQAPRKIRVRIRRDRSAKPAPKLQAQTLPRYRLSPYAFPLFEDIHVHLYTELLVSGAIQQGTKVTSTIVPETRPNSMVDIHFLDRFMAEEQQTNTGNPRRLSGNAVLTSAAGLLLGGEQRPFDSSVDMLTDSNHRRSGSAPLKRQISLPGEFHSIDSDRIRYASRNLLRPPSLPMSRLSRSEVFDDQDQNLKHDSASEVPRDLITTKQSEDEESPTDEAVLFADGSTPLSTLPTQSTLTLELSLPPSPLSISQIHAHTHGHAQALIFTSMRRPSADSDTSSTYNGDLYRSPVSSSSRSPGHVHLASVTDAVLPDQEEILSPSTEGEAAWRMKFSIHGGTRSSTSKRSSPPSTRFRPVSILRRAKVVEETPPSAEPRKYTLRELRAPIELLPGVDPLHKEEYLSEEEFTSLFKCGKEHFRTLPKWRQRLLKKQHGLH